MLELPRAIFGNSITKHGPKALQQAWAAEGAIYVNINSFSKDEHKFAHSERPFEHQGVASHPGGSGYGRKDLLD